MRFTTLLLCLFFSISVFAQNYDYGKVSEEELQEKFNPLDSTASATYLYKYRRTYFQYLQGEGFSLVTDIHERIKIYNKEGFEYASKEVNLHKQGGEDEEVVGLKGYTYNLEKGKLEKYKLEKDAIFKTEQSKYRDETKFTMPNIKEGSVIEYKYTINSPFIWNVEDFEFQHAIPVNKVEASFEAPEYFIFKSNSKGYIYFNPKNESKRDVIKFSSTTRTKAGLNVTNVGSVNYSELAFTKNITSFKLDNIPALKDEPHVNNINNYRSAVKYELSYVNFPESPIKYYSTTWEDVVKTIYDSSSFGSELDKTGYFEDDINAIISSVSDPITRISIIYNFVKSKVKWNNYYGKYTDVGVKRAYKEQVGNDAEINLMLTAMLRFAGLNANPVLVSSRHNGIPLFPTLDGYNYVISGVEMPDGVILLDATSLYSTPNVLPFRTLNWEGRIVRKDKSSSTISLYPNELSKNLLTMMADLKVNGSLEGSIRTIKSNHSAMSYREDFLGTAKEQFLEKLVNKYKGMEISDFEVSNDVDLNKPVMETYKFVKENQVDIIGDKIYFSPLFFLKTSENPFKLEKREFPIDYGYPSSNKYMIIINLPEGYKIESIPKPGVMVLPDNLGSYKYNIISDEGKIQLVVESEIDQPLIAPIYYDVIKAYFSKIVELEGEQIVLTKI